MAIETLTAADSTLADGEYALAVRTVTRRINGQPVEVQTGRLLAPHTRIIRGRTPHLVGPEQELRDYAAANAIQL